MAIVPEPVASLIKNWCVSNIPESVVVKKDSQ
jgi:hypothetical protein